MKIENYMYGDCIFFPDCFAMENGMYTWKARIKFININLKKNN